MNSLRFCIGSFCKLIQRSYYCKPQLSCLSFDAVAGNSRSSYLNFHSSLSCSNGKLFREKENEYAHSVMESRSNYSATISTHPLERHKTLPFMTNCNMNNFIDEFNHTTISSDSNSLDFRNPKFSKLIENVSNSLSNATDEQIINTLYCLCLWPVTETTQVPNFKLLWNMLDYECSKRLKNWTIDRKLFIADYWFHLRLSRITKYNVRLIVNLIENVDMLTSYETVQLMFYITLQRKLPPELFNDVEKKLASIVDEIDIEELSIVCLGFFKTQSKVFDHSIIKYIIKRLAYEITSTKSITVTAILKFLRKSLRMEMNELYITLMHTCIPCIENWEAATGVHLALLSSETNVYHPLLLDKVTERLVSEIQTARIKDGLKLLQSASHFNHYPISTFNELFFKELVKDSRKQEIISRPCDLVYILLFYAYMGHYNYSMIEKVLDPEFVRLCTLRTSSDLHHCLADLDCCVEIECPDYNGPRLQKSAWKMLNGRRGNIPSSHGPHNLQTKLLSGVYKCLSEIQGSERNILIRHVLPHLYSPDIVLRLNPTNDVKSLSELYQNYPEESILVPPANEMWACFVVCGNYSFAYRSKHQSGVTVMKLRQLEKLGYKVVFIPIHDLPENVIQRKKFMQEKLNILDKDCKSEMCVKL